MAEEMLKITRGSKFTLQGDVISLDNVNDLNDYLVQLLGFYTTLEEGLTLSELVHALYGMKKFIGNYFSEDYEVARAFTTATKLENPIASIQFYKSFRIEADDFMDDDEDEYVYILPEIKFNDPINEEKSYCILGDLPVMLNENLIFTGEDFSFTKKTKFTLLEILICVFEETIEYVKSGHNIKA